MTIRPLEGVRVLELASWVAAPSAGVLMADLVADVIKVEAPEGDAWRGENGDAERPNFQMDNRGKRSIVIDLKAESGRALVRRLCGDMDVLITNLTASRQRQYGLTAADVREVAPSIVHASMTAFGLEGPDAERAGFDNAGFWARSGLMGLIGQPGSPPGMFRGGQGDHTAGLALFGAVLAALRARDRSGEGQSVDASLYGAGIWTIGSDLAQTLQNGQQPPHRDRTQPANPLANTYPCADGRWLALVMPQSDRYWGTLCRTFEHPEWEHAADFASLDRRRVNAARLVTMLDQILATRTLHEWGPILDASGLIWEPVSTLPEVIDDPQAAISHRFVELERPDGSRFRTVNTPFQIEGADLERRPYPPAIGADLAAVLTEAGVSEDEAAELAASGAFG